MPRDLLIITRVKGNATTELARIDNSLKKIGKTAKKTGGKVKSGMSGITKSFFVARMASRTLEGALSLLRQGFSFAAKEALNYEDKLKATEALSKSTSKEMMNLHEVMMVSSGGAEQFGSNTADAALNLKKMGFETEEVAKSIPHLMDLSTASIVDLNEASKVTMQTMNSFGKDIDELEHVVNVIQSTVSGTSIDFMEYAEAMKNVAPIAETVGVSLEELSATIGFLGNMGLRGSKAGIALKNMLLNLLKPGETVADMMKRMDAEGKTFIDIMKQMKEEGMDINEFMDTFNKRALPGALNIANVSDEIKELTKNLREEETTAKEVAETMRTSFNKQLEIVASNLTNLGNQFIVTIGGAELFQETFDTINESLIEMREYVRDNEIEVKRFVEDIADLTHWFSKLVTIVGENIIKTKAYMGALSQLAELARMLGGEETQENIKGQRKEVSQEAEDLNDRRLALISYLKYLDEYNDTLKEINRTIELGTTLSSKDHKRREAMEQLTKKGDEIEVKFGLSDKFLDQFKSTSAINNNLKSLERQLAKIDDLEFDKFLKGVEKTADKGNFAERLKDLLEQSEAKEAADKEAKRRAKLAKDQAKLLADENRKAMIGIYTDSLQDQVLTAWKNKTWAFDNLKVDNFDLEAPFESLSFKADKSGELKPFGISGLKLEIDSLSATLKDAKSTIIDYHKEFGKVGDIPDFIDDISDLSIDIDFTSVLEDKEKFTKFFTDTMDEGFQQALQDKAVQIKIDTSEFDADIAESMATYEENLEDFWKEVDKELKKLDDIDKKAKEKAEKRKSEMLDFMNFMGDSVVEGLGIWSQFYDIQLQNQREFFEEQRAMLQAEKDFELSVFAGTEGEKYLISRKFNQQESILREKALKDEERIARKKKNIAIAQAAINTALAVTNTLATAPWPLSLVEALVVGGLGAAKIGLIEAQNFASGGGVLGPGTGASDSIPAFLSNKEYVMSAPVVEKIGGFDAVENMIQRTIANQSPAVVNNFYIEKATDRVEDVRETYELIDDERRRRGLVY